MSDLTKQYDYNKLLEEEKEAYSTVEITKELKLGGAHAYNSWQYYWRRIGGQTQHKEWANMPAYLDRTFGNLSRPIRILSLGSGYCGHEIECAEKLTSSYLMTCIDINEELFVRAREVKKEKHLSMEFRVEDLNFIAIDRGKFDLIFANAVLHHIINLEHLYEQIRLGLSEHGIFQLVEVVGMNRKLIWDENEKVANALLDLVPDRITRKIRLTAGFAEKGMEGIRQEDILPPLREKFHPIFECRHGAFMRYICTHPDLGRYFDPNDKSAKPFLDFLIE